MKKLAFLLALMASVASAPHAFADHDLGALMKLPGVIAAGEIT